MDVFEAAYRVAHDFPQGGAVGLARKMGRNPGTLLNEVNPNQETHKLGLGDSVAMSVVADDTRIAQAFCWALNGFFVKKPAHCGASDIELLTLWLQRESRAGQFAAVVERCYADGEICAEDWKAIEAAGMQYVAAFLELMYRFKGLRDA